MSVFPSSINVFEIITRPKSTKNAAGAKRARLCVSPRRNQFTTRESCLSHAVANSSFVIP